MTARKTTLCLLWLIVLAGITCLTDGQAYSQGLYWEQTVTVSMMGRANEMHTKGYLRPMKLRTVSDEESKGAIIRSDREIMYMLNMKDKTYSEMTFKEFEGQMSKATEQMKRMQKKLDEMPLEQRKMMEGMMKGMMGGEKQEYELKKTGEKKTVAGYSCEKVVMNEGDKDVGEFWVTKQVGSMKDFAKDWSKLMDKMAQGPMAKMYRKLAELDGFVMESKMSGVTAVTTKLEKRAITDDMFELPSGYKKVETEKMPEMDEMKED